MLDQVDIDEYGKDGQIALDRLRAVDRAKLTREIRQLYAVAAQQVLNVLKKMFS